MQCTGMDLDELDERLLSNINRALQVQKYLQDSPGKLRITFYGVSLPNITAINLSQNEVVIHFDQVTDFLNEWVDEFIKPLIDEQLKYQSMMHKYREAGLVLLLAGGSTKIGSETRPYLQERLAYLLPGKFSRIVSGESNKYVLWPHTK